MSHDHYFEVGGGTIRYRDDGHGPPVVLLHGWTLDLAMWEPQVAAFRNRFRVIRYDRRGFGLSTGQPAILSDVEDIGALCSHLDIGRFALLGMSQAARPALLYALAAPKRISCLILDGSPNVIAASGATGANPLITRFRELVRTQGIAAFRQQWRAHPLVQLRTDIRSHHELLDEIIARYPGNDLVQADEGAAGSVSADEVRQLDMPVMVMTGEFDSQDRIQAGDALATLCVDAQRAVIPHAGHLSNLDNSQQYNAVVGSFIEQHAVH